MQSNFAYKVCIEGKEVRDETDLSACKPERQKTTAIFMEGVAENVAFSAFAPIPLGWLAGLIIVYGARIFRSGWQEVVHWPTISRTERIFTAFCLVSTGIFF